MEPALKTVTGKIHHHGVAGTLERDIRVRFVIVYRAARPVHVAFRDHQHGPGSDVLHPAVERIHRQ